MYSYKVNELRSTDCVLLVDYMNISIRNLSLTSTRLKQIVTATIILTPDWEPGLTGTDTTNS